MDDLRSEALEYRSRLTVQKLWESWVRKMGDLKSENLESWVREMNDLKELKALGSRIRFIV